MESESVFGEGSRHPVAVRLETFKRFNERFFADSAVRSAVILVLEHHRQSANLVAHFEDGQIRVGPVTPAE